MNGKDNIALLFAACLVFGVFLIGGFMGYQVGQPMFSQATTHTAMDPLTFMFSGLAVLGGLITFQLGDVPAWLSLFYDMIITLCVVVPMFNFARGKGS